MSRADADKDAFRLRTGEPLRKAVVRVAQYEIDRIIEELTGKVDDEAVHEVRKATKRVRALLRLVRNQLGRRIYRRENSTFRDAARALSPARETDVLVATFDGLVEKFGTRSQVFGPFRRAARALVHSNGTADGRATKKRIITAMRRARTRCERWPIEDDGWEALEVPLRRIYRRGRTTWGDAVSTPSVSRLHEWRKRTKDLRYALQILEPVWPEIVTAYADEVDQLGDRLGEDHDLAMLRRFVRDQGDRNGADPQPALTVIDGYRQELQASVWPLAARIYEATPRRFIRRFATYWRAWEAESAARKDTDSASPADTTRRLAANGSRRPPR